MEITRRTFDDIEVIQLDGRFDAAEVPVITRWFDQNPDAAQVVINLSGVNFIDSSGLSALVKGLKHCRQNKGDLYLCEMQQPVRIIFELTRLDKAFTLYASEQFAIDAFRS